MFNRRQIIRSDDMRMKSLQTNTCFGVKMTTRKLRKQELSEGGLQSRRNKHYESSAPLAEHPQAALDVLSLPPGFTGFSKLS